MDTYESNRIVIIRDSRVESVMSAPVSKIQSFEHLAHLLIVTS